MEKYMQRKCGREKKTVRKTNEDRDENKFAVMAFNGLMLHKCVLCINI
jgi:hypothetical protein